MGLSEVSTAGSPGSHGAEALACRISREMLVEVSRVVKSDAGESLKSDEKEPMLNILLDGGVGQRVREWKWDP